MKSLVLLLCVWSLNSLAANPCQIDILNAHELYFEQNPKHVHQLIGMFLEDRGYAPVPFLTEPSNPLPPSSYSIQLEYGTAEDQHFWNLHLNEKNSQGQWVRKHTALLAQKSQYSQKKFKWAKFELDEAAKDRFFIALGRLPVCPKAE